MTYSTFQGKPPVVNFMEFEINYNYNYNHIVWQTCLKLDSSGLNGE